MNDNENANETSETPGWGNETPGRRSTAEPVSPQGKGRSSAAISADPSSGDVWERRVLERLATAAITEQRRARRWGVFFKFAFLAYLSVLLIPHIPFDEWTSSAEEKHTAVVEIVGTIGPEADASADRVVSGLRAAYEDEGTAGIVLRINSPGGSPVQAGYINDEIRRLRKKHSEIPVYAVLTDICASGGYYVAVAADAIYADKASLVGSIGVLMNSFGFVDTLEKLGIERRLLTAGEHKAFLDPFSPTKPDELAHTQALLDKMHAQFIEVVKSGRGERLKGSDGKLFSGYIWTGEESVALGLVDELGTTSGVARDVIGAERVVNFTVRDTILERLADRFGASMAQGFASLFGGSPSLR